MKNNLILLTDSYKQTHHRMYDPDVKMIYSYFEAREGAEYPETVFFGLQAILKKYLVGKVVTQEMLNEAEEVCMAHFGQPLMNKEGWQHIIDVWDGHLPLHIKAVPEGTVVPVSNVLMTVFNNDARLPWLTNFVETLLTHVWYPSTVATKSYHIKKIITRLAKKHIPNNEEFQTFCNQVLPFLVHDFGMRGVSSMESAAIGGLAHLTSFKGTDTMNAILAARDYYDGGINDIGYSVPASEHSVATLNGECGEKDYLKRMITQFPNGIVSIVSDSYNIVRFIKEYVKEMRELIISRWESGDRNLLNRVVIRPDSPRYKGDTPEDQVLWILDELWDIFGGDIINGVRHLHPAVGVIYGDGLTTQDIENIYTRIAPIYGMHSVVVGQGGGLLQKLNRDTQRFAFKCSACQKGYDLYEVSKNPLDTTKSSKSGILSLVHKDGKYMTVKEPHDEDDLLVTVFDHGNLINPTNFTTVRKRIENHLNI
jgi:nicotinamide phosphoribosyltransferase